MGSSRTAETGQKQRGLYLESKRLVIKDNQITRVGIERTHSSQFNNQELSQEMGRIE